MRRLVDAKGKRANGAGTVREKVIPGRPTRYQALGPRGPSGQRPSLGCFATFEEADRVREAAVRSLAQESPVRVTSTTLRVFGEAYLDEREHDAPRSVRTERARWKHVLGAPFIDDPIDEIDTPELQAWLRVVGRSIPGVVNGIKALRGALEAVASQDPHAMTRIVEALSAVLVVLVEERAEGTSARSA